MRISRESRFDASHRLAVTVEAARLGALDMVMDFADLGAVVRAAVLDRWDHSALLRRDDLLVASLTTVQAAAPERLVRFTENPTAEVLAREAFEAIDKRLPEGVRLTGVTVHETPTCSSEHRREDHR